MTSQPSLLFVFGLGYTALQLAPRLLARGWGVSGTVREEDKAAMLRARGIEARRWWKKEGVGEIEGGIPQGAHWLVTLPPDELGCPAARLAARAGVRPRSVTYLSTTGVYGDQRGGWVTERSPVAPGSARARARAFAERQWQALGQSGGMGEAAPVPASASGAFPVRSVRLPGIYGPGRSAFDKLREGRAQQVVKPGQVFCRVHVEDIATGLEAMLTQPELEGVFHLCDDLPAPPQEVTDYAAGLLGMAPPERVDYREAKLSPMAASFYAECKRVSNAKAKSALGWRPAYPTYREGLAAVLKWEKDILSP